MALLDFWGNFYVFGFNLIYIFIGKNGGKEDLYMELWKACAGPLVDVPTTGERVFYFPQGHMEQVSISTYYNFQIFFFFLIIWGGF